MVAIQGSYAQLNCSLQVHAIGKLGPPAIMPTGGGQGMRTLEQRFGRPEVIIDRTLDELRKLPRPGNSAQDLNVFAVKLQNIVCVLSTIYKLVYLQNPLLAREAVRDTSADGDKPYSEPANGVIGLSALQPSTEAETAGHVFQQRPANDTWPTTCS